jgi:hypothetical protein
MATFLYYFAPISACMFIFGLVNAIKYAIKEDTGRVIAHGVISALGFLMSLGVLLGMLMW